MGKKTVVVSAGDEIKIDDVELKIIKCGMHKEGDTPARPTVTIEIDDGKAPLVDPVQGTEETGTTDTE